MENEQQTKSEEIRTIRKSPSVEFKESKSLEYILNKSFFDPNSGTPPNDFMLKLQTRMQNYFIETQNE